MHIISLQSFLAILLEFSLSHKPFLHTSLHRSCSAAPLPPQHHFWLTISWWDFFHVSFSPFFCFMSPWVFYVLLIFLMGMMILHFRLSSFFLFFPFLFFFFSNMLFLCVLHQVVMSSLCCSCSGLGFNFI